MKHTGKIVLYSIYILVAVVLFLYLRFPSDTVRDLIVEGVSQAQPDLTVAIEKVTPVFPPGLKLTPFAVTYADMPIARVNHLKVVPDLLALFTSPKKISFTGPMGSGRIKGRAEITPEAKQPQTKATLNISGVPLEVLDILKKWPMYKTSGEMNAYLDYDSRKSGGGRANIKIEVAPARIVFEPHLMGLEQMEFSQIEADMSVTPRMLQIRRCEADGAQMHSKISGSIIFRQPLGNSRVTMSCTLKPQAAFLEEHKNDMIGGFLASSAAQKRGIVLRISGTLDNPRYVIR